MAQRDKNTAPLPTNFIEWALCAASAVMLFNFGQKLYRMYQSDPSVQDKTELVLPAKYPAADQNYCIKDSTLYYPQMIQGAPSRMDISKHVTKDGQSVESGSNFYYLGEYKGKHLHLEQTLVRVAPISRYDFDKSDSLCRCDVPYVENSINDKFSENVYLVVSMANDHSLNSFINAGNVMADGHQPLVPDNKKDFLKSLAAKANFNSHLNQLLEQYRHDRSDTLDASQAAQYLFKP